MMPSVSAPSSPPLIALEDVHRDDVRGKRVVSALRGVTLGFSAGSFVVIEGLSGSGKTTLLNLIGCLDHPSRGRVLIMGRDTRTMRDDQLSRFRADQLGFVFQAFNLIPVLTAYENVEYPLRLKGVPRSQLRPRTEAALEAVGLREEAWQRPHAVMMVGHLQVSQRGYEEGGAGNPGAFAIDGYDSLRRLLLEDQEIGPRAAVITGQLVFGGLINAPEQRTSAPFQGIGCTQEIGTIRAMGATRRRVAAIFFLEGLMLGLAGGVLGVGLGALAATIINASEILYQPPTIPFMAKLEVLVAQDLRFPLAVFCSCLAVTLAASYFPARSASRLAIAEALRH